MMKRFVMAVALFCAYMASAQVQPILQPYQTFADGSGNPCAGCKLYSYAAGTTTPQATYTDSSGTSQNTNPVVLNAAGGAFIWIGQSAYKFVLADTSGTVLWSADNVVAPSPGGSGPYLPLTGGTLTGSLTAPYFQFKTASNSCTSGQFITGWNASGWICSAPSLSGTAGGDLSGTYPNPTVVQINGAAVPTSATLTGTDSSGHIIAQTGPISNSTSGNAGTASALAAVPTNCGIGNTAYGIAPNGNALCNSTGGTFLVQAAVNATGCTTGGSSYAVCTMSVTWPVAFANTNYAVSCIGEGPTDGGNPTSGRAIMNGIPSGGKTTTGVTVQFTTAGSSAISFTGMDCVGVHN